MSEVEQLDPNTSMDMWIYHLPRKLTEINAIVTLAMDCLQTPAMVEIFLMAHGNCDSRKS